MLSLWWQWWSDGGKHKYIRRGVLCHSVTHLFLVKTILSHINLLYPFSNSLKCLENDFFFKTSEDIRGHRGWDGLTASPTRWRRVWVDSGSWWWTGRPGVLQSMGSQRVRHDWATGLNWTEGHKKYQCQKLAIQRIPYFCDKWTHFFAYLY